MEVRPLADVKDHLSEYVDRVARQHDRVMITRNGRAAAVLVSPEDLESLEETLGIGPDERVALREGLADLEAGRIIAIEDLRAELGAGG
jgi:prevent-host-death family protein